MNWTILKGDVFKAILEDKAVFVANPDEGTCKWANEMTVKEITELMSKNMPFFVESEIKAPVTLTKERVGAYIDVDKFTTLIKKERLSVDEFARLSGVNKNTVYRIIRRQGMPTKQTLEAFCRVLKVEEGELLE